MTCLTLAIAAALAAPAPVFAQSAEAKRPDVIIAAPDLDWKRSDPSAPYSIVTLWGDFNKGQAGVLLSLPGGFKGGAHANTSDYRAVVISGSWVHVVTETGAVRA